MQRSVDPGLASTTLLCTSRIFPGNQCLPVGQGMVRRHRRQNLSQQRLQLLQQDPAVGDDQLRDRQRLPRHPWRPEMQKRHSARRQHNGLGAGTERPRRSGSSPRQKRSVRSLRKTVTVTVTVSGIASESASESANGGSEMKRMITNGSVGDPTAPAARLASKPNREQSPGSSGAVTAPCVMNVVMIVGPDQSVPGSAPLVRVAAVQFWLPTPGETLIVTVQAGRKRCQRLARSLPKRPKKARRAKRVRMVKREKKAKKAKMARSIRREKKQRNQRLQRRAKRPRRAKKVKTARRPRMMPRNHELPAGDHGLGRKQPSRPQGCLALSRLLQRPQGWLLALG
mmetsp:Transcript_132629/g.229556  ORF Transcript_132629/g.229556 Transcript_132629/m.229556 type:complete len:341 (+) Transcript_132629:81-1103(+)